MPLLNQYGLKQTKLEINSSFITRETDLITNRELRERTRFPLGALKEGTFGSFQVRN